MHARRQRFGSVATAAAATALLLTGCDKPAAASWLLITQGDPCAVAGAAAGAQSAPDAAAATSACDEPAFYLDTANLSVRGGTPYVILQTRYADGRVGTIRAEVNCPRSKLEPTALKEAVSGAGAAMENRMRTISAADEQAVLGYACAKR